MQKYQSKILQNAIRLPAINWNLSFSAATFNTSILAGMLALNSIWLLR